MQTRKHYVSKGREHTCDTERKNGSSVTVDDAVDCRVPSVYFTVYFIVYESLDVALWTTRVDRGSILYPVLNNVGSR